MKKLYFLLPLLMVLLLTGCGGTEDPNSQAEDELALLDNHYNEIKTDIGNDAQIRPDDICAIHPSSQSHFYNGYIYLFSGKIVKSHCGSQFKERGM